MEVWLTSALLLLVAIAVFASTKGGRSKVPPGKFSFPFVGETFTLFKSSYFDFAVEHKKRFGNVFASHIFGVPTIFATTADAAKFFLSSSGMKSCAPSRIRSVREIVGEDQVSMVDGLMHTKYRRIFLGSMLPEALKFQVEWIDKLATEILSSWKLKTHVDTHQETIKFTYSVITGFVCEQLRPLTKEALEIKKDVAIALAGVLALPVNIPFTRYHKALKARQRLHEHLDKLITQRRRSQDVYNDLLQALISENGEDGTKLTNKQIEDNMMIGVLAGHHTTSLALVWVMKYLHSNPEILNNVKEEQIAIAQSKASSATQSLTWNDTKRMPLTLRVIHETLRLVNVARVFNREIIEDVEYDGYLFRKGWNLAVIPSSIHLSEDNFQRANAFDPSRFVVAPKPGTYVAFGTGNRICPGSELAKLEMLIFIHRLVTHYNWEPLNPDAATRYWPVMMAEDGYQIKISLIFASVV